MDTNNETTAPTEQDARAREEQRELRRRCFGEAPRSPALERAIAQVYFPQPDEYGHVVVVALDAEGNDVIDATAWALAHRASMSPLDARRLRFDYDDPDVWTSIGFNLLDEHRGAAGKDYSDRAGTRPHVTALIEEAIACIRASSGRLGP